MKITRLNIPEIILIEPQIFFDDRGFFFESFNHERFRKEIGVEVSFFQDSHSQSTKGVLRGLHYQLPDKAQGKLVRVVNGAVFDVVVDIRKNSPTIGQWVGEILTAENKKQLWIPEGFAHGFLTISDKADFLYKATNFYSKEKERSIMWNDPDINISWPEISNIKISTKDEQGCLFKDADLFEI
jgi:dTDP-4-dehydrorhamnose 3,5-epimerase